MTVAAAPRQLAYHTHLQQVVQLALLHERLEPQKHEPAGKALI